MNSVKALAESPGLNSIPSIYTYTSINDSPGSDPQDSIPVIDFSLLTSVDPDTRSQTIQELHNACKDWGIFEVINHGVPETLMNMVIENSNAFFNLTDEEKKDFEEKNLSDPIRYGTSVNMKNAKSLSWRDYLRLIVHPEFHCPNKPLGLSETIFEYSKRCREVARGLLSGISTGLGLDRFYIEKAVEWESGLGAFVINLYPPCPQPELAIGLPPHSDHGLLSLLIHNGVIGLQIKHNSKWIFSNGKYKSVEHRAIVNNAVTRISVVLSNGPALDAVVRPAHELVDEEKYPAAYAAIKYKEYMELKLIKQTYGKTSLDEIRVSYEE